MPFSRGIASYLSTLIVNLLASNQWVNFLALSGIRESDLRPALKTAVSSANIVNELSVQALLRSIRYKRKTTGPSTDLCGTPHKTLLFFEVFSGNSLFCNRLVRKVSIRLNIFPQKPYLSSLRKQN